MYTLNRQKQSFITNYACKTSLIPSKKGTKVCHYEISRFLLAVCSLKNNAQNPRRQGVVDGQLRI
jgi:hypothetical protein